MTSPETPEPPSPPPRDTFNERSGLLGPEKLRWLGHLLILAAYVGGLGALSALKDGEGDAAGPLLPETSAGLLQMGMMELAIFGGVFALALLCSRATPKDLRLGGFKLGKSIGQGILVSVALRVAIALALMVVILPLQAIRGNTESSMESLRPKIEALVDPAALKSDPFYLVLLMTFISFVVAGLREELWRAGMLAGFKGAMPGLFSSGRGQMGAVVLTALIFGMGHITQGIGGVIGTTLIGVGLGWLMVRQGSIWTAVMAHGFFNATTFLLLLFLDQLQALAK